VAPSSAQCTISFDSLPVPEVTQPAFNHELTSGDLDGHSLSRAILAVQKATADMQLIAEDFLRQRLGQ
jgi:hypothetical protein